MRAMLAVLALGFSLTAAQADDKPLERADLDKRIARIVNTTALLGTDTFNAGNYDGCYRLYQGTLMAVLPLLDHRPKLAESVAAIMARGKVVRPTDGAFILREALDLIQKELTAEAPPKKLWERMGEVKVARPVVHDFVTAAIADPKVNFSRGGLYKFDDKDLARIEEIFVALLCEFTGGPGQTMLADLNTKVQGLKLTGTEYDAACFHFLAALEKNKVGAPEVEEFKNFLLRNKPIFVSQ